MPRLAPVSYLFILAILSLHTLCVSAQFGNIFQDVFGQQHQQHAQQQHFQNHHGANVRGWQIQDEAQCFNGYVCPGTANCVKAPVECPCPLPEDFKCLLPTDPGLGSHANKEPFVCVRGTTSGKTARQECERIQKLAGPI
ncbi:Long chronological lifespan protein 2 [Naganishia albida]|nr:Long chronological lifespan protein 2 [Naganishia albida]